MSQALYRKYRSKSWDEVIGQEHITTTLKNSIKSGKISHAYLLSGPRGVGKTSVARILAHEVNNLDYDESELRLDIIEIDAASNRRIDEIRDLRDKVHIAPTSAKYKVYIIDEVHMLTKEAFNALLKTLEEPPEHCIFILATTEVHKLPETIVSRTQRFNFNPVSNNEVTKHLKKIAKNEKLKISDSALNLIARHGDGSFRDSISLLDQLRGYNRPIDDMEVSAMLGIPPHDLINGLKDALLNMDIQSIVEKLEAIRLAGFSPIATAEKLTELLKANLIQNGVNSNKELVNVLKNLLEVSKSAQPQQFLELTCIDYAVKNQNHDTNLLINKNLQSKTLYENKKINDKANLNLSPKPQSTEKIDQITFNVNNWSKVLVEVKKLSPSLYTVLRLVKVSFVDNELTLKFAFSLHYNKANLSTHKQILKKVLHDNYPNSKLKIRYELDKSTQQPKIDITLVSPPNNQQPETPQISTISNIFGGGEVLES